MKTTDFLQYLILSFMVNFIMFREKEYLKILNSLSNNIYSMAWLLYIIIFILMSYFSFRLISWSFQPKQLHATYKQNIFYWIILIVMLSFSSGLYQLLHLNYSLVSINDVLNIEVIKNIFSTVIISIAATCILSPFYKWISPYLSKLDWTRYHSLIINFNEENFINKRLDRDYWQTITPKLIEKIKNIQNILSEIIDEIYLNEKYILQKNQQIIIKNFRLDIIKLYNAFCEIEESKTYTDYYQLLNNGIGGVFDSDCNRIFNILLKKGKKII